MSAAPAESDLDGLVCVEYPGLVQDVDKMINTLGGLKNIGKGVRCEV